MAEQTVTDLFVYGTLKQGECRATMWPHPPVSIRVAYIQAQLYDLGPYPALRVDVDIDGDDQFAKDAQGDWNGGDWNGGDWNGGDWDWVQGELWSVSREHIAETLRVLDDIEGTNQTGHRNLYDQVLVRAFDWPGSPLSQLALVYHYSQAARLKPERRMRAKQPRAAVTGMPSNQINWREYTVCWTGRRQA